MFSKAEQSHSKKEVRNKKGVIIILIFVFISITMLFFSLVVLHVLLNQKTYIITYENMPIQLKTQVNFIGFIVDKTRVVDICIGMLFTSSIIDLFIILYMLYLKKN